MMTRGKLLVHPVMTDAEPGNHPAGGQSAIKFIDIFDRPDHRVPGPGRTDDFGQRFLIRGRDDPFEIRDGLEKTRSFVIFKFSNGNRNHSYYSTSNEFFFKPDGEKIVNAVYSRPIKGGTLAAMIITAPLSHAAKSGARSDRPVFSSNIK